MKLNHIMTHTTQIKNKMTNTMTFRIDTTTQQFKHIPHIPISGGGAALAAPPRISEYA